MKVIFENGTTVDIIRTHNNIYDTITKVFKHLQHVTLRYQDYHTPDWIKHTKYEDVIEQLVQAGTVLNIQIDKHRCMIHDQCYFNELHELFENNTEQFPVKWSIFHELIHCAETYNYFNDSYLLNYCTVTGPLEKPFDPAWMKDFVTTVSQGDVYVTWAELGKVPYVYWINQEPNDIKRMCELAKPWTTLKFKFFVANRDKDFMQNKKVEEFNQWWANYQDQWCQHWNIKSWTLEDMSSVIPIGKIADMEQFVDQYKKGFKPVKIVL